MEPAVTSIRIMTEPRRRRKPAILAAIAILAVAGGSAAAFWFAGTEPTIAAPEPGAPAVPVEVATPTVTNVPVYLDGLGTVQANYTVNITTRVDGELQSVMFNEGQAVKKGDVLAIIDPRPFQAADDQAAAKIKQDQADLANAQYLLGKDQKLGQQQIVTQETVEQQQSMVASAQAQLVQDQAAKEAADISLSYTQIRSPIDGRTGIRRIDAGNEVHTTDTTSIVTITQTQPITVISTLREDDLDAVRNALKAGPVEVTAMSMDQSQQLASGTLSLIDNEIDQASGTIRIKSIFENKDDALWPGQFVTLRVKQQTLQKAVTIPSAALERGEDGFFVYIIDPAGTAAVRKVTPGPIESGHAVIKNGLSGNEQVVTSGQYRLDVGTHVSIQQAAATQAASKE
jgi:multidrug efflux system membrane fusion protein